MKIVWFSKAVRDLELAADYIGAHNPDAADRVEDRLRKAVEHLERFPHAGRAGCAAGTREIVIVEFPYVIRYRVTTERVEILRIFDTAMQWPAL